LNRISGALACLGLLTAFAAFPIAAIAEPFSITSTTFRDGDMVPKSMVAGGNDASGKACGGNDLSPQLSWSGAPEETQSYAIAMIDIDGRRGAGVTHWLLYNIPATVTTLAAGAGSPELYTGGKNVWDRIGFSGPCTSIGEAPHHYVITLFALDTAAAVPSGLDRDGFLKAIMPHSLRVTSIIGRSVRSGAP
jgi:Raf kinase inhibitor-like YbhB/YbcL family protein